MIILGYPGVGKSTYAVNEIGVIDLESSLFHKIFELYVDVALDLSRQGNLVFVSCHDEVYKLLLSKRESSDKIGVLFPDLSLRESWIKKLEKRCIDIKLPKNERAYLRTLSCYEADILDIIYDYDESIQKYMITSMKYEFGYDATNETFSLINYNE